MQPPCQTERSHSSMRNRLSSVTMGRFMEVALLLVSLGIVDGSSTPTTQTPASTAAGTTTLPTPVSNNTQTGGQEYPEGVSYLLASFQPNTNNVEVAAGETGGSFLVDYPQLGYNDTRTVTPYGITYAYIDSAMWVTVGVENKAYIIHVFGKNMGVHGHMRNDVFSPLPISALGSRYVVSTCLGDMDHVVLVIASHNHKTDVDITLMLEGNVTYDNMTYNDGDTIHVTLDEYQTFTMKSDYDLTGTVINATNTVAVFSGTMQNYYSRAVTQLLPVRHHGTEYVMYTGDSSVYRDATYQLQVISDQSDTEIMLNNGSTFSLGDSRVYRQYLAYNEGLYLTATRPVMATLCRNDSYYYNHGIVVVVPVTYFVNSAFIPYTYCINILTKQHVTDIEVFSSDIAPVIFDWVDIPGSDYKAGRKCSSSRYIVRSASRFAGYGFSYNIVNGGYRFLSDPPTTGADAAFLLSNAARESGPDNPVIATISIRLRNWDTIEFINTVSEPNHPIPLVAFYDTHGLLKTHSNSDLHLGFSKTQEFEDRK